MTNSIYYFVILSTLGCLRYGSATENHVCYCIENINTMNVDSDYGYRSVKYAPFYINQCYYAPANDADPTKDVVAYRRWKAIYIDRVAQVFRRVDVVRPAVCAYGQFYYFTRDIMYRKRNCTKPRSIMEGCVFSDIKHYKSDNGFTGMVTYLDSTVIPRDDSVDYPYPHLYGKVNIDPNPNPRDPFVNTVEPHYVRYRSRLRIDDRMKKYIYSV